MMVIILPSCVHFYESAQFTGVQGGPIKSKPHRNRHEIVLKTRQ